MRLLRVCLAVLVWAGLAATASAHVLNITRVRVTFDSSRTFRVQLAIDLTNLIGTSEAYYQLSLLPPDQQAAKMHALASKLLDEIQFRFGDARVIPELKSWQVPLASHEVYADYYMGKMTAMVFEGTMPTGGAPFMLVTGDQAAVEYPLAYTLERPDRGLQITRFLEIATQRGEPFAYDQAGGEGDARAAQTGNSGGGATAASTASLLGAEMSAGQRFWRVQLGTLWRYLKLGFHHIVPEGTDHILFVLGLFFLGISWRKLLSQTSVFTVAHATTLYLSTQGIFSLPSWLVEPGIALSITFIAFENIFQPKLNAGRLVVVFFFGLVHGLGFASGLKELALPKHEFIVGLLGFNFGVDFGQLFIILLAFLLVGWFRKREWYFPRIAVPACVVIGLIGAYWTIERIVFYARLA